MYSKEKETYRTFCALAPDLPLFLNDWYLDASCGPDNWDAVTVEKAGKTIAAWPFFLKRKAIWRYVAMPPLTRMAGPYLLPEYRHSKREPAIFDALLDQMPPLAGFEQDLHYHVRNWLPMYWRGFRQTTRYSYLLSLKNMDKVWKNIDADYRKQKIPKALGQVQVVAGGSLLEFYRVHNLSYSRQGLSAPFSFDFLKNLDQTLALHGAREIFFAFDKQSGAIHSVAYLVWDKQSAYYLLAGDDPALRASGAGILLQWEAIRYTAEVLRIDVFDFAGSMARPIERVRRQFGAFQQPYFRIQQEQSGIWRLAKRLLR